MMSIYFTSDLHFGHANIIKYCKRPYNSIGHMDESLIANWNKRVNDNDQIYCLGDFGIGSEEEMQTIFDRLPGTKFLVAGNHDKVTRNLRGWKLVRDYYELRHEKQLIV